MTTTPDLWRAGFIDNQILAGTQDFGVVAPTNANQFFAVWVDHDNFNGGLDTIVACKFDSLGNPLTGDVPILTTHDLTEPAAVRLPIAGQGDGLVESFTRIFSTFPQPLDEDIFIARFNSNLGFLGFTTI